MRIWKARVKPAGSVTSQEVKISAETYADAKAQLEAQYGKNSIVNHHIQEVR